VYDGRLVVDAAMRCVGDPNILAAGPIARFSRVAGGQYLSTFSSSDVGAALADRILLAAADALHVPPPHSTAAAKAAAATCEPPRFASGAALGAQLPGGAHFALAGSPDATTAAHLVPAPGGYAAETMTQEDAGGFCQLMVNADGTITLAAYLGMNKDITPEKLSRLINMPAALLAADLQREVAIGSVRLPLPRPPPMVHDTVALETSIRHI
jgi:hypothetical protein